MRGQTSGSPATAAARKSRQEQGSAADAPRPTTPRQTAQHQSLRASGRARGSTPGAPHHAGEERRLPAPTHAGATLSRRRRRRRME
eukprot:6876385-Alexandrium_andersonii.AAC.1